MTRLGAVFWGGLVLASGFATFNVKYAVQGIDEELARVRRQTTAEQQELRVLAAEWAYLNQPERLAELNRNLLQLSPITTKQLQGRVEEIAMRAPPAAAPDAMLHATFAANPGAEGPAGGGAPGVIPGVIPVAATRPEVLLAAASSMPVAAAAPARVAESNGAEAPLGNAADDSRFAEASTDRAAALAEALQLLGIDAAVQTPLGWLAKAAPIASARAAEGHGADARGIETQLADASSEGADGAVPAAGARSERTAGLAEALHLLGVDAGGQPPRVRLAKAAPPSFDALLAKVAHTR